MDRETLEIVRAFVAESLDSLDEQEEKIQSLTGLGGKESIHSIFRVFHTIKGLSGFLSYNTINTVTHQAESLLDLLRSKPEAVSEAVLDVMYESFDVLRTLLKAVATVLKDTGYEEQVKDLVGRLQSVIAAIKSATFIKSDALPPDIPTKRPPALAPEHASAPAHTSAPLILPLTPIQSDIGIQTVSENETNENETNNNNSFHDNASLNDEGSFFSAAQLVELEETRAEIAEESIREISSNTSSEDLFSNENLFNNEELFKVAAAIPPDILQRYITEVLDLVAIAEEGCLRLEQNPHDMTVIGLIFGAVHSLKGNSGFMGFAEIEGMSADLENILDAVRSKTLEVYPGLISMILTNVDIIKTTIQQLASAQGVKLVHVRSVALAPPTLIPPSPIPPTHIGHAPTSAIQISTLPWSSFARETSVGGAMLENETENETFSQSAALHNSPSKEETPQKIEAETRSESASIVQSTAKEAALSPAPTLQRRDIRVDMDKLDQLFDLVGELITIEAMVTSNPDVVALELASFNKAAGMLNKITRELQEVTMSIRMMPLEGLFSKMKRLVRDLSLRLDKKINLEISGAETEMDKNIIEEVSDPLMHIIRNAVDHGIESREDRLRAGKSESGTMKLQARYEGNEILITIEDDGGGLNRQRILEKALTKGLLKVAPDKMTDREVNALIFEPGFSTAEVITDISGRGVGMDVVKRNIEKLQGSITVDTREGKGSRFTLRIPLTLAIMDAMMIRVGEAFYALPILTIRESFRPQPEAITVTMDGLEVVRVREELFSVIRLHELYSHPSDTYELHEGILMIVETRQKKACLFVDEIIGQQQIVVKSLSDYVGNIDGITGCMIMSNGEVGLIIDVDMLLTITRGRAALASVLSQSE